MMNQWAFQITISEDEPVNCMFAHEGISQSLAVCWIVPFLQLALLFMNKHVIGVWVMFKLKLSYKKDVSRTAELIVLGVSQAG